ncbi:hypothetical protein WR25_18752 isoform A [Diploscapter pachys]|uniref:One cut domain family member n=1 Tax=Diploscapter pachys TaxID=2018661 RepID=A0A2A2KSM3_9BILA|nr:hypothetical protein WR25_18752 isoform A [Diploscapter pachys]
MEPPAVTSNPSSISNSNGGRSDKRHKAQSNADYLQIDPNSTFISSNPRTFEDLPENFLDTISPQQPSQSSLNHSLAEHTSSPQLASLAPMSISNESSSHYGINSMGSQYGGSSSLDKPSFSNGPAGLLSPLHIERRHTSGSDYNRYIKEEDNLETHLMMSSSQQQDIDRETPPAVSNVELASTMIASIIGEQRNSSPSPRAYQSGSKFSSAIKDESEGLDGGHTNGDGSDNPSSAHVAPKRAKRVYSTTDASDPLNAEIDNDIYIDTRELCKRIAYELKQHSIPQAIFAERILCRSQGTLSDLLRNPKPWNKLKSGRETFRRMFNWVQQPLQMRLGILDMYKSGDATEMNVLPKVAGMSPPTPAQNVRQSRRSHSDGGDQSGNKRPRLVFTDIQKRTLQAIFRETQRPSREMQQTIAEHLRLDLSTVANFFMNARRRSRSGPNNDEPAPYQQVRPITPPPESPPRANGSAPRQSGGSSRRLHPTSLQHVEESVSSVAESAIAYSRELAAHEENGEDYKMEEEEGELAAIPDDQTVGGIYDPQDEVQAALTPLGDSPVDVVDRGLIKEEEDGNEEPQQDEEAVAN